MTDLPGGLVMGQGNAETLRDYWTHGKGAAQIRWGEHGDFDRCVRLIRKHAPTMTNPEGYCNELHQRALGVPPGGEKKKHAAALPSLVTLPGVDIVAAGRWKLASGEQTFTTADLGHAVEAAQCPAVGAPVIKIGHVDPRFDGEPALGRVTNMALAAHGNKITGDLAGMPAWLAAAAPSAYPRRSIEGTYDFQCQIGHTHSFVITGLALLGVTPPGVGVLSGLPDVAALYGVQAAGRGPRGWRIEPGGEMPGSVSAAAVTELDVRRAYYEASGVPQTYWITELQMDPAQLIVADEASSKVFRVPFHISAGAVSFDAPQEISVAYTDLVAMRGTGQVTAYASAEASRALPPTQEDGAEGDVQGGDGGPDSDGLDASWDDLSGLPDVSGLSVADLEGALAAEGGAAQAAADAAGQAEEAAVMALAKLGSGARFKALASKVGGKLAAWIGRKKFGKARFQQLASAARKRKAHAAAGGIRIDAAGRHGAFSGKHSHPHAAMGAQGTDRQHDHEHSHDGSGTHAHVHAAGSMNGGTEVDFTEDQRAALRSALALAEDEDLTAEAVIAAAGSLREQADRKVAASAPLPAGVMTIDKDAWDALNRQVRAGEEFRASVMRGERDQVIASAITAGKFGPARKALYERMWDADPDNARQIIASLPKNSVPVEDIGMPGTDDDLTADEYRSLFPPDYQSAAPNGVMGGGPGGQG